MVVLILVAVLIFLVAVLILPLLDLLGCCIFRLDSLFVGFLFRCLIWFCRWFCLSDMDFWWLFFRWLVVVFLVVGGSFLNLWCWF